MLIPSGPAVRIRSPQHLPFRFKNQTWADMLLVGIQVCVQHAFPESDVASKDTRRLIGPG